MEHYTVHMAEALQILEDRSEHDLELWKLSSGEIVTYHNVVCIKAFRRGGTHTVRFPNGEVRKVRDISLRYIDGIRIYY